MVVWDVVVRGVAEVRVVRRARVRVRACILVVVVGVGLGGGLGEV